MSRLLWIDTNLVLPSVSSPVCGSERALQSVRTRGAGIEPHTGHIHLQNCPCDESGSTRPRVKSARVSSAGSTRPGQVGLIFKYMVMVKADMR